MKLFLVFFQSVLFISSFAAIDPFYKEVLQRGYDMKGDSVIFPDGTGCLIQDFNEGRCGLEWKKEDYCIPEGNFVWDENKCCDGLEAYLPRDTDGQATCRKVRQEFSYKNASVLITALIFISGIIFLAVRTKAKKNMRHRRK